MKNQEFRAWDKKENRWVKPEFLQNSDTMSIDLTKEGFKFKNAGFIFCQFIGLKDKNGKKIFEGDIIKNDLDGIGQVRYSQKTCCFYWFDEENNIDDWAETIEVIGNIYEDSDLLEAKE